MPRGRMTFVGRGCPEVLKDEHTHRTGPAPGVAPGLNLADKLPDPDAFPLAYLVQRVPKLGLQAHTCASATRDDVSINQSTFRHDRPPLVQVK